jgi:hypothetical protein
VKEVTNLDQQEQQAKLVQLDKLDKLDKLEHLRLNQMQIKRGDYRGRPGADERDRLGGLRPTNSRKHILHAEELAALLHDLHGSIRDGCSLSESSQPAIRHQEDFSPSARNDTH